MAQSHRISFEEKLEQRFRLGSTHLLPYGSTGVGGLVVFGLSHPAECASLALAETGESFDYQFFFGAEVVEEDSGTGSYGLGERPERQLGYAVIYQVVDDGVEQLGGADLAGGPGHGGEISIK